MYKKYLWLLLGLLVWAMPAISEANPQAQAPDTLLVEELEWKSPADFVQGTQQGLRPVPEGVTVADGSGYGMYQSPETEAPIPFNALFSRWKLEDIEMDGIGGMALSIRTRSASGEWSEWVDVSTDADLEQEIDHNAGTIITVPASDQTHTHFQFSLTLIPDGSGNEPTLDWLKFTFIDSTAGVSDSELLALPPTARPETAGGGFPKPAVISRAEWCEDRTDLQCNYSDGLVYVPVTHLIVHHTVTSNSSNDWAATVRAIWYFHGSPGGQGWGDIGYNYLVAPNGLIFEGHLGGDNIVATHAGNANYGTMGVAMLGDYTTNVPSSAMRNKVADLLAWKADQQDIDVYDSSKLTNTGNNVTNRGLPHLMGHRDVYGGPPQTFCPGLEGHTWLPWYRDAVASRLGFNPPQLYFEEYLNGGDTSWFSKSNANWYTADYGCGGTNHAYFTYSTTNSGESVNWATWRPNLPASGNYQVEAFVPYCDIDGDESLGARYDIVHATGQNSVFVNLNNYLGQWIPLGSYQFNAGNSGFIYLSDFTTTDSGRAIWFDAVRFTPSNPPAPTAVNTAPPVDQWQTNLTVNFSWDIQWLNNGSSVRLQVATDPNMSNLVVNSTLPYGDSTSHTFSQSYADLYWRIIATGSNGSVTSPVTHFRLDAEPPTAAIHTIVEETPTRYKLVWSGQDNVSGIANYTVQFRSNWNNTWFGCASNITATSVSCNVVLPTELYWFRVRARDNAGNLQAGSNGDINTNNAVEFVEFYYFPFISRP